jgi:hypothetical protein
MHRSKAQQLDQAMTMFLFVLLKLQITGALGCIGIVANLRIYYKGNDE